VLLPNRFRVRGPLSNMTEFADAFKCPANSPMRAQKARAVW
jgi:predicted metalloendopeptidase